MPTFEALQALVFLVPGFLSETAFGVLCFRKNRTGVERIIEALMFCIPIYALYSLIVKTAPIRFENGSLYYEPWGMVVLFVISLVLPCFLAYVTRNGKVMKWLQKAKLTNRTGRPSLWHDVILEKRAYIVVHFRDGRRLYGWPEYFSASPEEVILFVSQAEWLTADSNSLPVEGEGILLRLNDDVLFVEAHKKPKD